MFRQVEGVAAVAARRVRDNVDAFRVNVREDIWKNGVRTGTWWISVLDCVDRIAVLVGHPNLTAVGPEACRHYSWSFNVYAKGPRDLRFSTIPVNPKDVALLARYDHVKAKCANMVERNPVVVRCETPPERRKQRDGTLMDLEDQRAFCGENVARGEPGRRGLRWSDSHVFFPAGTKARELREQRGIPVAVDLIDVLGAVFAHEQNIRPSGHAGGKGDTRAKGKWIGGVKNACERKQPHNCQIDFCSKGDFFHFWILRYAILHIANALFIKNTQNCQ